MSTSISNLDSSLQEQLVKLGDYMEILPLFDRKKTVKLNFKSYSLNPVKGNSFIWQKQYIRLPCLDENNQRSKFQLSLVDDKYYILESVGERAFILNGSAVYKALINQNDTVQIGYNKLKFFSKKSDPKSLKLLEYPKIDFDLKYLSKMNLLIEGETGTGKTHLARSIHEASGVGGEFVHINISSLSQSLVESELFGHVRGAFTGANSDYDGAIISANKGTLFIDEIDSLSKEMQLKLLLFLDNFLVRPVGSTRQRKVELQLIIASGRSLSSLVSEGDFRQDFYFRISNGFKVKLSAIREDVKILLKIIHQFEQENSVTFSRKLKDYYKTLSWPGNIRQLKGHLNRKMLLSRTHYICLTDIDLELAGVDFSQYTRDRILPLKELKHKYINQVFMQYDQDLSCTAKLLNVSYNTVKRAVNSLAV